MRAFPKSRVGAQEPPQVPQWPDKCSMTTPREWGWAGGWLSVWQQGGRRPVPPLAWTDPKYCERNPSSRSPVTFFFHGIIILFSETGFIGTIFLSRRKCPSSSISASRKWNLLWEITWLGITGHRRYPRGLGHISLWATASSPLPHSGISREASKLFLHVLPPCLSTFMSSVCTSSSSAN